jgi:GGDEF domain-containing protein
MLSQSMSDRTQDTMYGFGAGVMLAACAFSLILPGMEAVRQPIALQGGVMVQVGSSIGISISMEGSSTANLLQTADEAMYAAKHAGKGRIVQHSDLAQSSGT